MPIHDLVVKDVELVVATHGRSFWILDDLTPLHQLHDRLKGKAQRAAAAAPILFQPRTTVRLRISGGYGGVAAQADASRGPAWPGMVSYARTGASIFRVLPVPRPDGGHDTLYLDSGQNPPNGVVIHYFLPRPPSGEVTLSFLDAKGRELRSFSSVRDALPAKAGVNQFLWNRRLAGVPDVLAKDLEPVRRTNGPLVVPGRYTVRLTVDGRSQTKAFDIAPDPRVKAGPDALEAQFVFLKEILKAISVANVTINDIDALLDQVKNLERRATGRARSAALRKTAGALRHELAAIRGALIDVNCSHAQLWACGLHEKLNALFDTVDSGDYAPARQTREVFATVSKQLDTWLVRWRKAREKLLPAVNRTMIKAKLPAVG